METRRFGQTDLQVSRIGFGCWGIGGHGYGRVEDSESIAAIRRAVELGISLFDTADVYGFGHSEEILGKALGRDRSNVVVSTKFGVAWDASGNTYKDCHPSRVVPALDASLTGLQLDRIPLYHVHWYDDQTPIEDTLGELIKCQEQGKIQHISCSNFSTSLIRKALQIARLESTQCSYNILEQSLEDNMIDCHLNHGMGVVTYGLLARGLLSGKYGLQSVFGEDDSRQGDPNFCRDALARHLHTVRRVTNVGEALGLTPSQVAIRWALENPIVSSGLVGMKTVKQVEENVGADTRSDDFSVRKHLASERT
jgi:myo-inositol catabolism protein IolS